jgi:tetratricopeptide (TPR) repeat protein
MRQIGFVLGEQGKLDDASAIYKDAIARAHTIGDRLMEGILLNDYGQIIPRAAEALTIFQQSLAIGKDLGDERLVTAASLNLANKQDGTGHVEDALVTYADVIERAKAQHDDENLATAEMNMAESLMKLDRNQEAMPLLDKALASFKERGDENGVGYALGSRGDAHMRLGDLVAARADYDASLALRTKLGEARNVAQSQNRLARLDLDEDRAAEAEPLARAAADEHRKENDVDGLAQDLRTLGRVLIVLGKRDEAVAAIGESEKLAKPEPTAPDASEHALIRGLADPAHADAQLAIIQACQRANPTDLPSQLDEAELERGLGHAARARTLLQQVQSRAKAAHAGNILARTTRLLAKT